MDQIKYLEQIEIAVAVYLTYVQRSELSDSIIKAVCLFPRFPLACRHPRLHPVCRSASPHRCLRRLHGAKVPNQRSHPRCVHF